ncbi:MAG TPA: acyltransferase family protein, partial [Ktedonobacteraceae bacterium]|nr:acyltransferase family protein [Ktedonobacteraceae bacterium]
MRLQAAEKTSGGKRERLYYLDWLKVLAVLVVFYAHSIDALNFINHNVEYATHSTGILIFTTSVSRWGMSFFFLLAGAGAWFALNSRTVKQFVVERFNR